MFYNKSILHVISFKFEQLILMIHIFFNKKIDTYSKSARKACLSCASLNELCFDQVKCLDIGALSFKRAFNNTGHIFCSPQSAWRNIPIIIKFLLPIVSFPFVVNLDGHLATFYRLLLYGTRCAPFPFLGLVSGFVYCIFSCQSIY